MCSIRQRCTDDRRLRRRVQRPVLTTLAASHAANADADASGYRVLISDLPEKRLSEKRAEAYQQYWLSARRGDTYRQRKAACALAVDWSVTGVLFAYISISEGEEYWDDLRSAQKQKCFALHSDEVL